MLLDQKDSLARAAFIRIHGQSDMFMHVMKMKQSPCVRREDRMANETVSYYVLNEHTLGYIDSHQPNVFGILHGSVLRGSPHDWRHGFTILTPGAKLRPATLDDFDAFNVSAHGHLIPVQGDNND